jgi:hypothetical protein
MSSILSAIGASFWLRMTEMRQLENAIPENIVSHVKIVHLGEEGNSFLRPPSLT